MPVTVLVILVVLAVARAVTLVAKLVERERLAKVTLVAMGTMAFHTGAAAVAVRLPLVHLA